MRELREATEAAVRAWNRIPAEERKAILIRLNYNIAVYSATKT